MICKPTRRTVLGGLTGLVVAPVLPILNLPAVSPKSSIFVASKTGRYMICWMVTGGPSRVEQIDLMAGDVLQLTADPGEIPLIFGARLPV